MRTFSILPPLALLLSLSACDWMKMKAPPSAKSEAQLLAESRKKLQQACASAATYDRLKELLFEEAIRVRNADPVNLDTLATNSVVRMEAPLVKSRDEELNVTVCTGRFILELPPGAERGFGGERRIFADIEYAAQAAADGSGLVYQMRGAEPIIYKLAAFDLRSQGTSARVAENRSGYVAAEPISPPVVTRIEPEAGPPLAREVDTADPTQTRQASRGPPPPERPVSVATTRPSFNCRSARTRSEKMVCNNGDLAALDRSMSSLYYSALSGSRPVTRAELRRTRDRFLSYRERCGSRDCVADAYRGRINEIRDIMSGAE